MDALLCRSRFNPKNPNVLLAVVNSAPSRSQKKKIGRKSFLIRWELPSAVAAAVEATTSLTSKDVLDPKWTLRKVRCIGNRAITVFEIR